MLNNRNFGLKLEQSGNKKEPQDTACFSDNDYAGDPVSRRSITGFMLCVLDVAWKLSGLFITGCKRDHVHDQAVKMHVIQIKHSVMVRVDNLGVIFMAPDIRI